MRVLPCLMLIAALFSSVALQAESVGTSFTYQGELQQSGIPANGSFDFQFELYDTDNGGVTLSAPVILESVSVQEGIFQVELDFGLSPFIGDQLWLEIGIKETGIPGTIILEPRQKLTSAPYAIRSFTAETVPEGSITDQEIDVSSVQKRVAGACSGGNVMQAVNADGSVDCVVDSDTNLSEAEVDSYVANNDYSTGSHTVDTNTQLTEAQVDSYVANNGYGDITAVTVGSGLTGGGASGSVSLSVGTGAITATHLATNSVGAAEIAANAVGTSEVADNTLTANDLAANSVGISELNTSTVFEPSRNSWSGSSTFVVDSTSGETIRQITVSPPTSGTVLAIGSCSYFTNVSSTNDQVGIYVTISTSSTAQGNTGDYSYFRNFYAAGSEWNSFTIHNVFTVTTATTTFYLRGDIQTDGDTASMYGCNFSTIFIPT